VQALLVDETASLLLVHVKTTEGFHGSLLVNSKGKVVDLRDKDESVAIVDASPDLRNILTSRINHQQSMRFELTDRINGNNVFTEWFSPSEGNYSGVARLSEDSNEAVVCSVPELIDAEQALVFGGTNENSMVFVNFGGTVSDCAMKKNFIIGASQQEQKIRIYQRDTGVTSTDHLQTRKIRLGRSLEGVNIVYSANSGELHRWNSVLGSFGESFNQLRLDSELKSVLVDGKPLAGVPGDASGQIYSDLLSSWRIGNSGRIHALPDWGLTLIVYPNREVAWLDWSPGTAFSQDLKTGVSMDGDSIDVFQVDNRKLSDSLVFERIQSLWNESLTLKKR
jgi:hypothetical protein